MTARALAVLSLALVAGCASRAATMAAPAPFSFDRPAPETPSIRRWLLLGPFDINGRGAPTPAFIDEAAAAPRAGDAAAGRVWTETRTPGRALDFRATLGTGELSAAYAFTWLHVASDRDAVIWIGADNQARVLLDGVVIHDYRLRDTDSHGLAVRLTGGVHRLLLRVENCGGPHGAWAVLANASGGPLSGVMPSLSRDDEQRAANAAASPSEFTHTELLALLPLDPERRIAFDTRADVARLAVSPGYEDACPMWREEGGPEYGPNPGRRGVLGLHAASDKVPERAYWKVHVPDAESLIRLTVSAEAHVAPGVADGVLRVGVFCDGEMRWLKEVVLGPYDRPDRSNWCVLAEPLPRQCEGRDVLVILEAASGGRVRWHYEGIWFDEIEIVPAK